MKKRAEKSLSKPAATSAITTMNISLSQDMRGFVERRMKERGFTNASEYVRSLVRSDEDAAAESQLERILLEGLKSGKSSALSGKSVEKLRGEIARRAAELKSGRRKGA